MGRNEVKTPGRTALVKWLKSKGHGASTDLAKRLGVDVQLVSQWANGWCRPGQVYRDALARLAQIDCTSWETSAEKKRRTQLEKLQGEEGAA